MKKSSVIVALAALVLSASALRASEIVKIALSDGETMTGKLDLPPGDGPVRELVMFIAGTGPNTYLNHRKLGGAEFNYFDLFVDEFAKRGAGFFAYNRRGVEIGDTPPYYDAVDKEKYKKYLPGIETKDIGAAIAHLRGGPRLKGAKVILLGWSEGTILAAMAAENADKSGKIDNADFKIINSGRLKAVMSAVEGGDDAWIWANFFRVTSAWLKEYFALEANKTRLLRLDLPIYIFHGEDDANVSMAGVLDLQARFAQKGKTNLKCFIFKGHDHDLNYMLWPVKKTIPEGIRKIFDVAGEIGGK